MTVGVYDRATRIIPGQLLTVFLPFNVVIGFADPLEMGSLVNKLSSSGPGTGFWEPSEGFANVHHSEVIDLKSRDLSVTDSHHNRKIHAPT